MRRRVAIPALLITLSLAGRQPSALAQTGLTPPPLDEVTDEVVETVNEVVETIQDVAQSADPVGSAGDSGGGGGVASLGDTAGSATGDEVQSGGAPGDTAAPGTEESGVGGRSVGRSKGTLARTPDRAPWLQARPEAFNEGVAASPVTVTKTNDADRDSSYSDTEAASVPGADVSFRVAVANRGAEAVSIIGTYDFFPGPTGVSERQVCRGLVGRTLAPGESVACMFTLTSYAPPRGESKVNTVSVHMLVGDGAGSSVLRTLFATDSSKVASGSTSVLGLVLEQLGNGALARTGAAVQGLSTLAMVLAAVGSELLRRGRARGRAPRGHRVTTLALTSGRARRAVGALSADRPDGDQPAIGQVRSPPTGEPEIR